MTLWGLCRRGSRLGVHDSVGAEEPAVKGSVTISPPMTGTGKGIVHATTLTTPRSGSRQRKRSSEELGVVRARDQDLDQALRRGYAAEAVTCGWVVAIPHNRLRGIPWADIVPSSTKMQNLERWRLLQSSCIAIALMSIVSVHFVAFRSSTISVSVPHVYLRWPPW